MKYYARYLIFSLTVVTAQNYRGSEYDRDSSKDADESWDREYWHD